MLVQKYGGTSVADPDRIKAVAEHVVRTRERGDDVVVVRNADLKNLFAVRLRQR